MSDDKQIKRNVWGDKAKQRFLKQHGTLDVHELPESDAHAIKPIYTPIDQTPVSPEEQKAAEELLERHIKELQHPQRTEPEKTESPEKPEAKKAEEKPKEAKSEKPKNSSGSFYDEWID